MNQNASDGVFNNKRMKEREMQFERERVLTKFSVKIQTKVAIFELILP